MMAHTNDPTILSAGTTEGRGARLLLSATVVIVILAMYPWIHDTTGPIKWLAMAMGVLMAWGACTTSEVPLTRPGWTTAWLMAFLAYYGTSAFFAVNPGHAAHAWTRIALPALAGLLAAQVCRTPASVRPIVSAFCGALTLCSLYALSQRLGWDPFTWAYQHSQENYGRLPGTLGNPNYAAHVLAPGIVASVYLAYSGKKVYGSKLWLLATALFVIHMGYTGQRGGLTGLALAGCLVTAYTFWQWVDGKPATRVMAILLTTVLIPVFAAIGIMAWTYHNTGNPFPCEESLYIRYNGYDAAARMAKDQPLIGFGPGHFEIESPPYWTSFDQRRFAHEHRISEHVHNEFFEFAVESGIPGLLLFTAFLSTLLVSALWYAVSSRDRELRRFALFVTAILAVFAADALFGFNLRLPASGLVFFLVMGMAEGVWRHTRTTPALSMRASLVFRWSCVLVCAALMVFEGRVFLSRTCLYQASHAGDALEVETNALNRAAAYAPWDWVVEVERGALIQRQDHFDEAATRYERALDLNPHAFMALANLAECRMRSGMASHSTPPIEEALEWIRKLLKLSPNLPEAHEIAARCQYTLADLTQPPEDHLWAAAQSALMAALETDPPAPDVLHVLLAEACQKRGDYVAAKESFAEGLSVSPRSDALWQAWTRYVLETREPAELLDTCAALINRHARQVPPDHSLMASLHTRQARLRTQLLADKAGAENAAQQALANDPWYTDAWDAWIEAAGPEGANRVREALTTRMLESTPNEALPPVFAALRLFYTSGPPAATQAADLLLDAFNTNTAEPAAIAWAAQWLCIELVSAGVPDVDCASARHRLGRVLFLTRQLDAADQALQMAAPALPKPERIECVRLWADVLEAMGRIDDARKVRDALDRLDQAEGTP